MQILMLLTKIIQYDIRKVLIYIRCNSLFNAMSHYICVLSRKKVELQNIFSNSSVNKITLKELDSMFAFRCSLDYISFPVLLANVCQCDSLGCQKF